MKVNSVKELLALEGNGEEVCVEGWIRTKRDSTEVSLLL
jgi:aspartyl/asparaginyl-tRNA synthetase